MECTQQLLLSLENNLISLFQLLPLKRCTCLSCSCSQPQAMGIKPPHRNTSGKAKLGLWRERPMDPRSQPLIQGSNAVLGELLL